jgi:hypothetical protein
VGTSTGTKVLFVLDEKGKPKTGDSATTQNQAGSRPNKATTVSTQTSKPKEKRRAYNNKPRRLVLQEEKEHEVAPVVSKNEETYSSPELHSVVATTNLELLAAVSDNSYTSEELPKEISETNSTSESVSTTTTEVPLRGSKKRRTFSKKTLPKRPQGLSKSAKVNATMELNSGMSSKPPQNLFF